MTTLDDVLRELKKRNPEWSAILETATKSAYLAGLQQGRLDNVFVSPNPDLDTYYSDVYKAKRKEDKSSV